MLQNSYFKIHVTKFMLQIHVTKFIPQYLLWTLYCDWQKLSHNSHCLLRIMTNKQQPQPVIFTTSYKEHKIIHITKNVQWLAKYMLKIVRSILTQQDQNITKSQLST